MSCSLITRIASRRKSGSKPSPTLRRYSSSATLTSVIGASFVVDLHTHEEAPMTVCCQPLFTPPAETLSRVQPEHVHAHWGSVNSTPCSQQQGEGLGPGKG